MEYKDVASDICRRIAERAKPFLGSAAVTPIAVVLLGLILHAVFSYTPRNQVVLGGPVLDELPASVAKAADFASSNPILDDEALTEQGPVLDSFESGMAAATGIFDTNTHLRANDGALVHVVRPGETLYGIASRYGVDQRALAQKNKAVGEVLIVGDELIIPAVRSTKQASTLRRSGVYLPSGFIWPITGVIRIGVPHGRPDPVTGELIARDIPSPVGTPVLASGAGSVIEASYGWNGGYGNRVIVDHSGVQTLYAHLSDILVHEGEAVMQGQAIGLAGNTGHSTGPHVHFEVRWQ